MEEKNLAHDDNEIKSELMPFCYDDSSLSWYVRYILDNSDEFKNLDSYQLETGLENIFNDFPSEKKGMSITSKPLSKTKSFSREKYIDFIKSSEIEYDIKNIEILKDDREAVDVNIADRIAELYYYLMFFSVNKYPVYYAYFFRTLLERFYKLSAECVFHRGNNNLNELLFRKSMTLEALYSIGKIPFLNSEKKRKKGYAYCNVCSPFVAESLLRTVHNLECAIDDKCNDSFERIPVLKKLRTEILINKMITSFSRSTSYNRFTNYRVALNRHNSELLSIPYNELSSVQEVKPLGLFEKITSHIHFCKEDSKSEKNEILNVKVAVIGHAEVSYGNQNEDDSVKGYREIYDLLRMIVDWYARIETQNESDAPNLRLEITYFVNDGDVLEARNFDVRDDNEEIVEDEACEYRDKESGNHYGQFVVEKCSYYSDFYFSKTRLKEIIKDFGLVFVLDCPWMTTENYGIMSDGTLLSYCSYLEKRSNIEFRNFVTLDSDKNTGMQYLDVQYNRITSSESVNSGLIASLIRDDYLKTIVNYLKKSDFLSEPINDGSQRKDVYIFTSEKDGVDYSYLGSYPLLRKEMYDDKIFSIAHFSNRKSEMLEMAKDGEKLSFHIRLWSIFKYVAFSYVSVHYRDEVDEVFSGYSLSAEDYFELMRASVIKLTLSSDLNNICVSIGYDESIMEKIKESLNIRDDAFRILKCKLYEHLKPFVKALYEEVIFSDYEAFGYNTIRTAFEMNMYESAQNVESMLFIHLYKDKWRRKRISDFDVEFNFEKYDSFNNIEQNFENFRDKRLYQSVFQILERTHVFNIGTNAVFSKAKEIYDCTDESIEEALLENIAKACEKMKKTDSSIYKNALTALREL